MFISKYPEIVVLGPNSCMPDADRFIPRNDAFPASSLRAASRTSDLKNYLPAAKQSLEKSGFNTMI